MATDFRVNASPTPPFYEHAQPIVLHLTLHDQTGWKVVFSINTPDMQAVLCSTYHVIEKDSSPGILTTK